KQCALADGELRLGPDAEKLRRLVFETVLIIDRQAVERRPFLTAVTNKLAFVFANCATRRRFGSRAKLRSALHANEVLHRERVMGQDRACPSNFLVGGTTSVSSHYCSRQLGGALKGTVLASRVGKHRNCSAITSVAGFCSGRRAACVSVTKQLTRLPKRQP